VYRKALSVKFPTRQITYLPDTGISVKRIGIINCFEVSKKCTGSGCFKAFHARTGSFARYVDEEVEIISFVHCNGCAPDALETVVEKARRMKEKGVDVVHLSTCTRSRCPMYDSFMEALGYETDVEGHTHAKKKP